MPFPGCCAGPPQNPQASLDLGSEDVQKVCVYPLQSFRLITEEILLAWFNLIRKLVSLLAANLVEGLSTGVLVVNLGSTWIYIETPTLSSYVNPLNVISSGPAPLSVR